MELYRRIKLSREALGLSQQELADKMGYRSRSTIAKIEAGENDIPQSKIIAFARALNTTPASLMGWDGEKPIANIDDGLWDAICGDERKLSLARLICELPPDKLDTVIKILDAVLQLPRE